MDYELAKELKGAGFPQHHLEGVTATTTETERGEEPCYKPTLEELIEACGAGFANLEREDEGPEDGGVQWIAFKANTIGEGGTGSTPTEAVAKLWLALNKKTA
jgi:hypothetical protein